MREVRLLSWCDICWQESETQTAALHSYTIGIVIGESRPALKLLELCEPHSKTIVDLQNVLQQLGQAPELAKLDKTVGSKKLTPEATKRQHPTIACPVCHHQIQTNVMVAHIWKVHRDDKRPPIPKICPQCRAQVETGTGMSAHMRNLHHYSAIDDALSGVKGYQPS